MECIGYNVDMAKRIAELYDNGAWTIRSLTQQRKFVARLEARMRRKPRAKKREPRVKKRANVEVESEVDSDE